MIVAHSACFRIVANGKFIFKKNTNEKYTNLTCDIHKAWIQISNTPSCVYQQTEYLTLSRNCHASIWFRSPEAPSLTLFRVAEGESDSRIFERLDLENVIY
jgi:hypothetical protein